MLRVPLMTFPTGKTRVLIADDERVIADTLALILDRNGFEARAVYTSREALAMAPVFQPDILISDVLMTDINGVDAAVEMRGLLSQLRVFLLSGQSATGEMLARSQASGLGFEVMVKPIHPTDLLNKLNAGVAREAESVLG